MNSNIRSNVIVNIIRTLVLTILSFVTFPWICRCLGEAQVGIYSWANTFVMYFLILAKVGLPNLAVRECVKVRDNKELLSNRVQTFFLIQLITTIASFALMCCLLFAVPALRENSSLIFILSINFLVGVFSFEWVFIALEKQFYMSVRSIITLALSAILIISFVSNKNDLLIYAFIAILTTVFTTICNCFYIRKFISFKKTMPYNIKQFIKPLSVLCVLSLALTLYNQTDTFILGFIDTSMKSVANYSIGVKGIDVIIGIITALSTVFIPRAEYYYEKEDKRFFRNLNKYSVNICLFIVLPAIVTMTILSKEICGIISGTYDYASSSSEYQIAPTILIILASMMITYSLSDIIYGQILLPLKKEKIYSISIIIATIANIILSIVFGSFVFKSNPAIGVALETVLTDLFLLVFLVSKTWTYSKDAIFNKNSLKLLAANIILVGSTFGFYYLSYFIWRKAGFTKIALFALVIVSVVILDALIYVLVLRIMKENLIYSFTKKRRQEIAEEEAKNA